MLVHLILPVLVASAAQQPVAAALSNNNATTGLINVRTQFGALGDGTTDDGPALQAAIDHARITTNGIFFPAGNYKVTAPLIFGFWRGILVKGGEPGDAGIAGGTATVTLTADLKAGAGACFDFTGAGYGTVEGLDFQGSNCKVMVLNARPSNCTRPLPGAGCDIYGSDITYSHCNFAHAPVAAFANHMGEVLTFRDCRFKAGGGSPGLLLSWRLQQPPYSIQPPSGAGLTTGVTLTVFRVYGGEFTGDNSANIVLDMENATTSSGSKAGGSTVLVSGAYFAEAGGHMAAVQVRGRWSNVHILANRLEDITDNPNEDVDQRMFLELAGVGAELDSFSLNTFGDCCTSRPGTAVIGGAGSLNGGTVTSDSFVRLGAGSSVTACTFHLSGHSKHYAMLFAVDGNVTRTTILSGEAIDLQVTGMIDIDDSRGGRLVHHALIDPAAADPGTNPADPAKPMVGEGKGDTATVAAAGAVFSLDGALKGVGGGASMLQAHFAGAALLVQCVAFDGELACGALGPAMRSGPLALGKLESACHGGTTQQLQQQHGGAGAAGGGAGGGGGGCTITASYERAPLVINNGSRLFEVRRIAGASMPLPPPKPAEGEAAAVEAAAAALLAGLEH